MRVRSKKKTMSSGYTLPLKGFTNAMLIWS